MTHNYTIEIAAIAARYGVPRRVDAQLRDTDLIPLSDPERVGEVCMVLRRTDGTLLTGIKRFYPAGAHRLLTGGIMPNEPILAALEREVYEETGYPLVIERFIAVIRYPPSHFVTYAFLLTAPAAPPVVQDPNEELESFGTITVAELPAKAAWLAALPDQPAPELDSHWGAWGRFRAVVHQVVAEALA